MLPVRIRITIAQAAAVTAVAGVVGWILDRLAVHAGAHFPSFGYLLASIGWKLWTLAVLAWAVSRFERRRLDAQVAGLVPDRDERRAPYPWRGALVVALLALIAAATVGSSSADTSTYGDTRTVGLALAAAELLVRYPLTVLAEEALFRGWMQPRLGVGGPVLSAVFWAAYHLQQVSTIPSLMLIGLGLGFVRWLTGTVRVTAPLHYAADAAFFVAGYM
jgi:membrane protease YdiL (CAAX protease family)